METPENQADRDLLFAFAHGIRMTLKSLGMPFDGETVQPILKRMDRILGNPKDSLIRGNDSVSDWAQFRHLREVEAKLCFDYLLEVAVANGVPKGGSDEAR